MWLTLWERCVSSVPFDWLRPGDDKTTSGLQTFYTSVSLVWLSCDDIFPQPPVRDFGWNRTRRFDRFGPACPQLSVHGAPETGVSEDCLTLNVWIPQVSPRLTGVFR